MALGTAAAKSSSSNWPRGKIYSVVQIVLRILAIAFSLVSICVMVTSTQVVVLFGINFSASYRAASAWRFLLGVDIVTCIASALLLILVCVLNRSGSHLQCFLLFLLDMAIMVLLISGCAAATAIGYVSKYGEFRIGWSPVCNTVPKFCNKSTISLAFSYLAFLSYLALSIMSACKFMSRATDELSEREEGKGNENGTS